MSKKRSIEEINEKIRNGKAVVLTAEQVSAMGKEMAHAEIAQKVDVVTTATFRSHVLIRRFHKLRSSRSANPDGKDHPEQCSCLRWYCCR